MNITPPVVSTTPGPQWAQELNDIITNTIAEHNHQSPNGGVTLTQDALNINGELSVNANQITNVEAIGLATLAGDPSGSNRLYNDSGDLYYKDGNDALVRITENGGLAAASFGGISGLSGTNGSATFAGLSTFQWKKDVGEYASMENGPVKVYSGNDTNPAGGINLITPDGLSTNYTLTLPTANITLPQTVPNAIPTTTQGTTSSLTTTTSSLYITPSGEMVWNYVPPLNFVSSSAILTGSYGLIASEITNSPLAFTSSGRPVYVEVLGGENNAGYWVANTTTPTAWMSLQTKIVHQNGTTYYQGKKTFRVVDENTLVGSFYPYTAVINVPSGTMTISLLCGLGGGGIPANIEIGEGGSETYFSARQL